MASKDSEKKPYDETAAAAMSAAPKPVPHAPPAPSKQIIINTSSRYTIKPHQYLPGGWLKSPAQLDCFRATEVALVEVAAKRGLVVNQVTKVRVARVEGEKKIYIYPTDEQDEDGLPVNRAGRKLWINLISFLAPAKLCVEQGYKDRYELLEAGPDSPVGPALYFDMNKPAERATFKARKPAPGGESGPGAGI